MFYKLNKIILFYVLIWSVVATCAYADTISIQVFPKDDTVNPATVGLSGKLYTENIWLEDVSAGTVQAAADETFMARIVAVNQNGTADEILQLWDTAERTELAKYVTEPAMFSANQAWYKSVKYSALLAKVVYGNYTVFIVQHTNAEGTNVAKQYPLKLSSGAYVMSNGLSEDPIYVYYMLKIQELVQFKTKPQPTQTQTP